MPKFISEFKEGEIVDFPTNRKYEFVRALKSGGTGKTILMQDTMLNKFFVCKKYSPMQKQYEKEFYNRFIDEIKIMQDPPLPQLLFHHFLFHSLLTLSHCLFRSRSY